MPIPLPTHPGDALLQGLETGANLRNNLLNRLLQQQTMEQQAQLFPYQIQGMEQQAQLAPLQQQLLTAQAAQAQQKANIYNELQKWIQENAQAAQQSTSTPQPLGNQQPTMDALPAAMLKAFTGIDPYMRSPEYTSQLAIQEARQKEQDKIIAEEQRDKTYLTPSEISKIQEQFVNISTALPEVEKLLNINPQRFKLGTTQDKEFFLQTLLVADKIAKAQNLPNAQKIIDELKDDLGAGTLELDADYYARINRLYDAINHEAQALYNTLETKRLKRPEGRQLKRFNPLTGQVE